MTKEIIKKAVAILNKGGLIGLPTETVYGLAGDAKNSLALQKIFTAKNRPLNHPLIVHIGTTAEIHEWAQDISENIQLLIQKFWPGPLTLILNKQPTVSSIITGGQDSIGLRMPRHPLALELLTVFGSGLAAPSANQFGHISPTCPNDVLEELSDKVDLILPGGVAEIGIESTIVDVRTEPYTILRLGAITQAMLETTLKQKVAVGNKHKLHVSGNLPSHYAPYTPVVLLDQAALKKNMLTANKDDIFLLYTNSDLPKNFKIIQLPKNPEAYAHELYASLRKADHQKAARIIVEKPPTGGLWDAITERLNKAAGKKPT
jgi:L-threonylcarbamoyladenylate synthase